jgi:hypothetical protein
MKNLYELSALKNPKSYCISLARKLRAKLFNIKHLLCSWSQSSFSLIVFSLYYFFSGTRIWTQVFILAKQALYPWSHSSSSFCSGYFGDGVLGTICPGWPQIKILPISASPKYLGLHVWATGRHTHLFQSLSKYTETQYRPCSNHQPLVYNWQ